MTTEANTGSRRRRAVGLVGFAAILAAIVIAVVDDNDGATGTAAPSPAVGEPVTVTGSSTAAGPGTRIPVTGSGTSSAPPGRTTSQTPSAATHPVGRVDTSTVVWPWRASAVRYDDPVEAARGFATDFAGFTAPVVGPFLQGDSRSGEVEVRPRRDGPVTTVLVRQLEDRHWWIIGSISSSILLDSPTTGDRISSPVRLIGKADTYEGHVDVRIRQDGSRAPIGSGYVTGCQGQLCPFDGEVSFSRPTATAGAILLSTTGGEDNQVWQITVVRVVF